MALSEKAKATLGLSTVALILIFIARENLSTRDAQRPDPAPAPAAAPIEQADQAPPGPPDPAKVDLGSTARCGCVLAYGNRWDQPTDCQLSKDPDVVGLEGYVRTSTPPIDLLGAPWLTKEYEQTGPNTFDPVPSPRKARTKVRILEVKMRDSPNDNLKDALVRVRDVDGSRPRESWIDMNDFDAVPWWLCTTDKALTYSPIIARPDPTSRPTTLEGRWIRHSIPPRVWCWYFLKDVGVYCDPHLDGHGNMSATWVFKPSELKVEY